MAGSIERQAHLVVLCSVVLAILMVGSYCLFRAVGSQTKEEIQQEESEREQKIQQSRQAIADFLPKRVFYFKDERISPPVCFAVFKRLFGDTGWQVDIVFGPTVPCSSVPGNLLFTAKVEQDLPKVAEASSP